jgi:hypothetical protein
LRLFQRSHSLLVFIVLQLMVSKSVLSADYPALKWTVSDDTLSTPLGAIIDVGVDKAGVVYLLDRQSCVVHRFDIDGSELPSLGQRGEGPGEFRFPSVLTVFPAGGCVVISDFNAPSVCFTSEGDLCKGPDLSGIRDRFTKTVFMVTARADLTRDLFLIASTNGGVDPASRSSAAFSAFRLTEESRTPVVLFTNNEELGDESTVNVSQHRGPFIPRCWDVDENGRIIYADPSGNYSVFIGHPADGENYSIDLPVAETDSDDLDRVAKSIGQPVYELPRIVDVLWIGPKKFIIKPTATVSGSTYSQGGIVEVFDTSANSYGRYSLYDDVDGTDDSLFLSRGHMVIVEGGWSARRASVGIESAAPEGTAPDVIRIHLYDLRMN